MEERRKDDLEVWKRLVALETQMGRLMSHLESEKGTQERIADRIDERFSVANNRISKLEHTIWLASGAVALIVLLVNVLEIFIGKLK